MTSNQNTLRRRTAQPLLINTPLQRGAWRCRGGVNRFNGFWHTVEPVETVCCPRSSASTPVKWGANETEDGIPAYPRCKHATPSGVNRCALFLKSGNLGIA